MTYSIGSGGSGTGKGQPLASGGTSTTLSGSICRISVYTNEVVVDLPVQEEVCKDL